MFCLCELKSTLSFKFCSALTGMLEVKTFLLLCIPQHLYRKMQYTVSVSPSAMVMYISEPSGGRARDTSISEPSKISLKLEPTRDALIVEDELSIEEEW